MSKNSIQVALRFLDATQLDRYINSPTLYGDDVIEATKRHARFLQKAYPAIGYRKHLEVLARSAGCNDWFELERGASELTLGLKDCSADGLPSVAFNDETPYAPSSLLLIQVPQTELPRKEAVQGLKMLAEDLQVKLGFIDRSIYNVLAKLRGYDSWEIMIKSKGTKKRMPLYSFYIDDFDGAGIFRVTNLCDDLITELDQKCEGYDQFELSKQAGIMRHVEKMVDRNPDFLEGKMALAAMLMDKRELATARTLLQDAFDQATNLIPADFKGEIIWGFIENRFYHRIMSQLMQLEMDSGNYDSAVKLAKRQLKLNPSDNLGVRYDLPILLSAAGKVEMAIKSLKKVTFNNKYEEDSHALLVRAIVLFSADQSRYAEAYHSLLSAVVKFPALVPMITKNEVPNLMDGRKWHCGVIPDVDSILLHLLTFRIVRPEMYAIVIQFVGNEPALKMFNELHSIYLKACDKAANSMFGAEFFEAWEAACKKRIAEYHNPYRQQSA